MSVPRIALSGSSGTGKTTLGRRLAAELGVPFIEEGMRTRIEAGLRVERLDQPQLRALHRELWDEHRERVEAEAQTGFVVDRSSADFAGFWLHYGFLDPLEETERWLATLRDAMPRYDRILLFPWGALPLVADGTRSPNRWTQFRFQALVEAFLARWTRPGQLIEVPATQQFDERLASVRRSLADAR